MNGDLVRFIELSSDERRGIFATIAHDRGTVPEYIEKDFWVCVVLDGLFNGLPSSDHPEIFFKGGTSLSKVFNLINRFSEDVDVVVSREGLGFYDDKDPTSPSISNNARKKLYEDLREACSDYVVSRLMVSLKNLSLGEFCEIVPDSDDPDAQSLQIKYPTLYEFDSDAYVSPYVKLECGARSACDPHEKRLISPYVGLVSSSDWNFDIENICVISAGRTYLDKLMILHGSYHAFESGKRLPRDGNRISRHYYDFAQMTDTPEIFEYLTALELLSDVREHTRLAFNRPAMRYDLVRPGSINLVPYGDLLDLVRKDYVAMSGMMFGDIPDFDWIIDRISHAEKAVNQV